MMKQKRIITICSFLLFTAAASSCGMLGNKDPFSRKLAVEEKDPGCLDNLGPLMTRFTEGSVTVAEWDRAFTCLDDTLNTFSKFVGGHHPDGFNHADIRALVKEFIITRKPISDDMVVGFFDIKASFFGGNSEVLTRAQLTQFRALLQFLKTESTALIPHLKNRKNDPTEANLRAFVTATQSFGDHFADYLNSSNNVEFPQASAVKLMRELAGTTAESMTPDEMQAWTETILGAKYALIGGAEFGVSGQDWKDLIRKGFALGGNFWAFSSIDESHPNPNYEIELALNIQAIVNQSIQTWNGSIPVTIFERIAKVVPASILASIGDRTEDLREALQAILKPRVGCLNEAPIASNGRCSKELDAGAGEGPYPVTYRAGLLKLLGSKSVNGFDQNSIQTLVDFYVNGKRADYHLNEMLKNIRENLLPETFVSRANQYAVNLDAAGKASVERLKLIATRYRGLHQQGSPQIVFGSQSKHSQNNLSKMNWYELMAQTLLKGYGTGTGSAGPIGSVSDLFTLVQDFNPVLIALSMVHPDKREVHKKRFREANLFMPSGDGSLYMGLKETTEYFAFLFSSAKVSKQIKTDILAGQDPVTGARTGICNVVGFDDKLKIPTYDIDCFRREYIARYAKYFQNMPGMLADLNAMTAAQRANFSRSIETSSKMFGYDNNPISAFDIDSYGGISHFVEGVMQKYDTRGGGPDGYLDEKEVNNDVFPVFKNELAGISGTNIGIANRAILLWLMQKGTSPIRCKNPSAGEIWNLIKWLGSLGPMDDFKARRMRVYDVFEALSLPKCEKDQSSSELGQENEPSSNSVPVEIKTDVQFKSWLQTQPEYQQLLEIYPQDK